MAQSTENVFETAFDAEVKRQYEGKIVLQNKVYSKGNIIGDKIYFNKVGSITAHKHNTFSDVTYSDPQYGRVGADFERYEAAILVDKPNQDAFTFDEASISAEIVADAIVRISTQVILNAIATTKTPEIGDKTKGLNVEQLQKAKAYFDRKGVPGNERYALLTATQLEQLMSETKATSNDYVNVKALIEGNIKNFLGFEFLQIPDMKEGGLILNKTNDAQLGFIYHKRSVGYATPKNNNGIKTSKDWIATKRAWQVIGEISCASAVIDDEGVIPLLTKI